MNEMNSLETQLHSWQPRHPSAGLKRRLFGQRASSVPRMAWVVGWLVPATACALMTFSIFTAGNGLPGRSAQQVTLMSLSNNGYLAAEDTFQHGQNSLLSVTYDLTNGSGSNSAIPDFPGSRMN